MTKLLVSRVPHAGMPPLDQSGKQLSFFEFWPAKLFYFPVFFYVLYLMIRYRSITLPSLANPSFPAGGFCGESKSHILALLVDHARDHVADFVTLTRCSHESVTHAVERAQALLAQSGMGLPVVAKPDLGCRGAGVRLVRDADDLVDYITQFPVDEKMVLQRYVDYEGEAGVFYIRDPETDTSRIFSLTLKYFPYVTGDGMSTLRQLVLADPRAGRVPHLYLKRLEGHLDWVPPAGLTVRIAFSGSHSKGAIFRDGTAMVTQELHDKIDDIARKIPGFYFGRFDIRFESFSLFQKGKNFTIVELNGAGAEATHVWDRNITLWTAWKTLMAQYKWTFVIGDYNRRMGYKPIKIVDFYTMYAREKNLISQYPVTQ